MGSSSQRHFTMWKERRTIHVGSFSGPLLELSRSRVLNVVPNRGQQRTVNGMPHRPGTAYVPKAVFFASWGCVRPSPRSSCDFRSHGAGCPKVSEHLLYLGFLTGQTPQKKMGFENLHSGIVHGANHENHIHFAWWCQIFFFLSLPKDLFGWILALGVHEGASHKYGKHFASKCRFDLENLSILKPHCSQEKNVKKTN